VRCPAQPNEPKNDTLLRRSFVLAVFAAAASSAATGQPRRELRVWTARALATVLSEVGSEFEKATGHRLVVTSDLPAGFARRAAAGESFDLLISMWRTVDAWIREGKVTAETRSDIARSGVGVEVRAGARKPDISSVDAFKRALLDAKSIAYLRVGSGIYVDSLIRRLGIADAVQPKVMRPETDIVSELVANGEVELGLVVITQILTTPGVELVGPLPPEIQSYLMFTAAVAATSPSKEAAKQLVSFLRGPKATPVIRAQGMEPARPE
jgi:molybdate transport system substrate-binding protein